MKITSTRLGVLMVFIAATLFVAGLCLITKANPSTIETFKKLSKIGEWTSLAAALCAFTGIITNKPRRVAIISFGAAIWLMAIFAFFIGGGDPAPLDQTVPSFVVR